jgi:hypothetical protein
MEVCDSQNSGLSGLHTQPLEVGPQLYPQAEPVESTSDVDNNVEQQKQQLACAQPYTL